MAGSNITEVSSYSANVVGPDAGDKVTAASVRVMGTALANRTKYLNDVDATKASLSGATFTGVVTGDVGEFNWPVSPADRSFTAQVNNSATVSASDSFVMKKSGTVSTLVPTGGSGYTAPVVWTTPSVPWILDGALIQITGTCTADADPSNITLTLYIGAITVVIGTTGAFAGGTTYTVDGSTSNPTIFGLKSSEKGTLLTQPYANSETDDLGFGLDETSLTVAVLANGGALSMWGQDVSLTVVHGSMSGRTLSIPYKIIMWGRLL